MQVGSVSRRRGRVLVTGANGFTGRYLTKELTARAHQVVEHTESVCDLRDVTAMRTLLRDSRPDFVVHLAAISFVPFGSPASIYEVNTVGTTNLLDAVRAERPDLVKILLASSSQVYGRSDAGQLDEASPCAPVSHYGCSKLAMEHMAATYTDLPIVIARPFNYTGPGQSDQFLVPKIVAHFARREDTIELGNLDVIRDFSDVRMVVDAYCRMLEMPESGQAYNVCSGTGRSLRWVVDECARLCQHDIRIVVRPEFVRSSDIARLVGSCARLTTAIGPLPYTDFAATLRSMLDDAARSSAV